MTDNNNSDDDICSLLRLGLDEALYETGSGPSSWDPPGVEELRQALPQYGITSFIARGGMGAVYPIRLGSFSNNLPIAKAGFKKLG